MTPLHRIARIGLFACVLFAGLWQMHGSTPALANTAPLIAPPVNQQIVGSLAFNEFNFLAEVRSYNWNVTVTPGTPGSGSTSKPVFGDFVVVTPVSPLTVRLSNDAITGKHEKQATITIFAPGTGKPLITYTLKDVTVTFVRDARTGTPGDIPLEEVHLAYAQFQETLATP